MKFCYIDESEANGIVVAVGVIVDGSRMHLSKAEWASMLGTMSTRLGAPLSEFKAKDLYGGNGRWHGMPGPERAAVIDDVVTWLGDRKHALVFSGVLDTAFAANTRPERADLPDMWCAADRHLILAVQKCHQTQKAPKGHTVVIADQGVHESHLADFVRSPESWTDDYYGKPRRADRLSQIVDVPFFVNSEHAVLVQTADLFAYILRRYAEMSDLGDAERYVGELAHVTTWARCLAARAPLSDIWPTRDRKAAHAVFREIAPASLVGLRS